MTPGEIRRKTLSELRRARKRMISAEWLTGVEELPADERAEAATALLDVCLAVRRLENTGVAALRRQFAGSGKALEQGIAAVERAGKRVHRIRAYLNAVTGLAATVGRVVKPL